MRLIPLKSDVAAAARAATLLALLFALVLGLAPSTALAHAKIASSTPREGAEVQPGLTSILIVFSEEVSLNQTTAEVLGPNGAALSGVTYAVNRAKRQEFTITTPPLVAAGQYKVNWKAVTTDDNGITRGTITFRVAASAGAATCNTFSETGQKVCNRFLEYWQDHGGLAQQGFPISGELQEKSDTDGKTYKVQYFERAVFELHPDNAAPNDVLLALLGNFLYAQKYPNGAPNAKPNSDTGAILFPETGKRVGGKFLQYWREHGGLAQQGFPISEEFQEKSALDGKTYTVQYFERAVFEMHPDNQAPYDVLLSQLGTFRYQQKSSGASVVERILR